MAGLQRNLLALAKRLPGRAAKDLHSVRASNMAPAQDTQTPWFYYPHSPEKLIPSLLFVCVTDHQCGRVKWGCPSKGTRCLCLGQRGVKGICCVSATAVLQATFYFNWMHQSYKTSDSMAVEILSLSRTSFYSELSFVLRKKPSPLENDVHVIKNWWKMKVFKIHHLIFIDIDMAAAVVWSPFTPNRTLNKC